MKQRIWLIPLALLLTTLVVTGCPAPLLAEPVEQEVRFTVQGSRLATLDSSYFLR